MSDLKMGPVETRFAEIIWDREPVGSTELVRLAEEALGWKKSTTYTVLKRLCDRGIFPVSYTHLRQSLKEMLCRIVIFWPGVISS